MAVHGSRRETRARHEEAARLRACGFSWATIATHLGYSSRSGAQAAVERLYARTVESPTVKRRSLSDGLNLVRQNLFEGLADAKRRRDNAAILGYSKEIRSVTDQQAKLEGLHSAQKIDVNVTTQTIDDRIAELRKLMCEQIEARSLNVIDAEVL